ncbi:NAD(P)-dependent dehydrogenase (short-subunit alcohol dehydrogenase family) [Streptosporangium album]|uniref:NAD(P)-dependent dehydrogenase (Short-subunit alcohol dehydrogenase family) n=1 Tax=Streptosporangium album TaxID=47479 RepID=A0A7W7WE57_9ACTN|nr:SDR family oxidoreductase [Streptosporangium album]MBB4944397.1 NAD(P)-dependent dehydrogenase (short-subunit alcohol dehydrogenase family) [Streptosporangium album]
MGMSGLTALVTGATAGIGRAIAIQLAQEGAEVVVHGRDARRGAEVVAEIEAADGAARFIQADLTDTDDVLRLAEEAGEVDVLINNAGIYKFLPTSEMTGELFDLHMNLNTKAPYLLVRALAPGMVKRGRGSIVNISTLAVAVVTKGTGMYSASKAALEQLTEVWAAEYADKGVRVNAVAPGPTRTPGTDDMDAATLRTIAETTAMGRIAEPEEVAEAAVFLASQRASYITGVVLEVGGGRLSMG